MLNPANISRQQCCAKQWNDIRLVRLELQISCSTNWAMPALPYTKAVVSTLLLYQTPSKRFHSRRSLSCC